MMYSEFVEGTGCKDNAHNHKVFENLEVMYMNTNMSKAEIYEYGKKLVDNSKSEKEIEFENTIKGKIEEQKHRIAHCKEEITYYGEMLPYYREQHDDFMVADCKASISYFKDEMKKAKIEIAKLEWVLK